MPVPGQPHPIEGQKSGEGNGLDAPGLEGVPRQIEYLFALTPPRCPRMARSSSQKPVSGPTPGAGTDSSAAGSPGVEAGTGGLPPLPERYEDALAELESLVSRMESGALPLDDLLVNYRRGAQLLEFCRARLEAVEAQVKVLEGGQLKPWEDA